MRGGALLLLVVVVAASGHASSANDFVGDEIVEVFSPLGQHGDPCDDPGADIVHFKVDAIADELVMGLGVASADPRIRCLTQVGVSASFIPELRLVSIDDTAPSFYLTIREEDDCGRVEVPGRGQAVICGEHSREGEDVTWRIPLEPTVVFGEENVTLDLSGAEYRYSAEVNVHGNVDPFGEVFYNAWDKTHELFFRVPTP